MRSFAEKYLGTFEPPDKALLDLARDYYRRCEAYDLTVCTGPMGRDGIMPATSREFGLINRNATAVFRENKRKAAELGYSDGALREAMRAVQCESKGRSK